MRAPLRLILLLPVLLAGGAGAASLEEWRVLVAGADWHAAAEEAGLLVESDSTDAPALSALVLTGWMDARTIAGGAAKDLLRADSSALPLVMAARGCALLAGAAAGQAEEALGLLSGAADAAPEDPVVLHAWGTALLAEGLPDSARVRLEGALEADPGFLPAALTLSEMEAEEGDTAAAVRLLRPFTSGEQPPPRALLRVAMLEGDAGLAGTVADSMLDSAPGSTEALFALGWASERGARTSLAVDYYLQVLEEEPGHEGARERLRVIADPDYDPERWLREEVGPSATARAELSMEGGNRELLEVGGSATLSYVLDGRGTSVDLALGARAVRWEESAGLFTQERETDEGWATLTLDYPFYRDYYLEAGGRWDRQRFTVRPWQVSTYLAAGWQGKLSPRLTLSPELGGGWVATRWREEGTATREDRATIYAAGSLRYRRASSFISSAVLEGDLYFPPDSPEDFLSGGSITLGFRTFRRVSLGLGYELDYVRNPESANWEKLDTRFTTSLTVSL